MTLLKSHCYRDSQQDPERTLTVEEICFNPFEETKCLNFWLFYFGRISQTILNLWRRTRVFMSWASFVCCLWRQASHEAIWSSGAYCIFSLIFCIWPKHRTWNLHTNDLMALVRFISWSSSIRQQIQIADILLCLCSLRKFLFFKLKQWFMQWYQNKQACSSQMFSVTSTGPPGV